MKVLMFGWEFPPVISGGLGTACFGLTRGLAQEGIDITFVVPRVTGKAKKSHVRLIDASSIKLSGDHADTIEDVRIRPVDSFLIPYMTEESYMEALEKAARDSKNGKSKKAASWEPYGPDLYSEVLRYSQIAGVIAKQESCSVIHTHDWMTIPAGIEAKNQTGKPLVAHMHSLESDRSMVRLNERIYGIERLGMMEADHIIAVSHYTKRKIVDQYGIPEEKISVVHNAALHFESRHKDHIMKDPSRKFVLFLGRITAQKGPDYFLEAARKVLSRNPDIHFIMAGSGDMMGQVKEKAARLEIENNVHFTGFLRGADVEKIYAMSDLYVMPSVSDPFGITALEAIMCGVPVIISSQSGVSEVLQTCPKVDFWNTGALADRIMEILENDALREEIVGSCREEMKNVNWKIAAEKIIDVYQRLLMI